MIEKKKFWKKILPYILPIPGEEEPTTDLLSPERREALLFKWNKRLLNTKFGIWLGCIALLFYLYLFMFVPWCSEPKYLASVILFGLLVSAQHNDYTKIRMKIKLLESIELLEIKLSHDSDKGP